MFRFYRGALGAGACVGGWDGMGWVLGIALLVGLAVLIGLAVYLVVKRNRRSGGRTPGPQNSAESAQDILKLRLARGEIDEAAYDSLSAKLKGD